MLKDFFVRKKKYATVPNEQAKRDVPEGLMKKCNNCYKIFYRKELNNLLKVCPNCDYHHQLSAWERVDSLFDENTFQEWDKDLVTNNPLRFPDYEEKLAQDQRKTELTEAVVTGKGLINGHETSFCVMDARFRMGSMGSVVGEKIARTIERANTNSLPFIVFTASGGARMQEGVVSLMQMAKTSMAVKRFS